MQDREKANNISQLIFASLAPGLAAGGSKLHILEQVCEARGLGFREQPSPASTALAKKIFGTRIRCVGPSPQQAQFSSTPSLTSLAYVLLRIAFDDDYVMRLIIDELNLKNQCLALLFKQPNPYNELGIQAEDMHRVFAEVILKINSLRAIFPLDDILKDYYLASATYALFLRMILVKIHFHNAHQVSLPLNNTEELFGILCEYFDLNAIAKRSKNVFSSPADMTKDRDRDTGQGYIFLFSDFNLFISSADNKQFCCGKYYSNETELLRGEREARKSTFQLGLMLGAGRNEEQAISQTGTENQSQSLNESYTSSAHNPAFRQTAPIRMSQVEMDLGANNSFVLGVNQSQTPYFSSNAGTPEFGELMDSARFKKSLEFNAGFGLCNSRNEGNAGGETPSLVVVEEEILDLNSPGEDGEQSFHFAEGVGSFGRYEEYLKSRLSPKKDREESDLSNKPRSPPSSQPLQSELMVSEGNEINDASIKVTKPNMNPFLQVLDQKGVNCQLEQNLLKISLVAEQRQQNSFGFGESDIFNTQPQHLAQPCPKINHPFQILKQIQQNNMHFPNVESISASDNCHNDVQIDYFAAAVLPQQEIKSSGRRDNSNRKYSVNEKVSGNDCNKAKAVVYQSNHFDVKNQEGAAEAMQAAVIKAKSQDQFKNNNFMKGGERLPVQSQKSETVSNISSRCRKMELSSRIVDLQLVTAQSMVINHPQKPNIAGHQNAFDDITRSKSPQANQRRQQLMTIVTSRHFSQHARISPNRIGMQTQDIKKLNKNISKGMKTSDKPLFNKQIGSSRLVKTGKFPEFLRNFKSEKFLQSEQYDREHLRSRLTRQNKDQQGRSICNSVVRSLTPDPKTRKNFSPLRTLGLQTIQAQNQGCSSKTVSKRQSNDHMRNIKSQRILAPFNAGTNRLLIGDPLHRPWVQSTSVKFPCPSIKNIENPQKQANFQSRVPFKAGVSTVGLQELQRVEFKSQFLNNQCNFLVNGNFSGPHAAIQRPSRRADQVTTSLHQLNQLVSTLCAPKFNTQQHIPLTHNAFKPGQFVEYNPWQRAPTAGSHFTPVMPLKRVQDDRFATTTASSTVFSKVQSPTTLDSDTLLRSDNFGRSGFGDQGGFSARARNY